MIQHDLEQRQSTRFLREFLVTDYDDLTFSDPFEGYDVNLTGLSFWVKEPDLFFPGQILSLRLKNLKTDEIYCLEGVKVVHQRALEGRYLCGCHITQVTSSQLLAHHRIVMADAQSALISMRDSQIHEFNFVEDGSPLSTDQGDYQEASMALNLAVSQMQSGRESGEKLLDEMRQALNAVQGQAGHHELQHLFEDFANSYQEMMQTTVALGMLAKLLAHTPEQPRDKQAWKTMIADFERRFLSEQQQIAYDFMHQGLEPDEALRIAEKYLKDE